jgi:addiction module HigA family antidote
MTNKTSWNHYTFDLSRRTLADHLRVPGRTRLGRGDRGLSLKEHRTTAIARTRPLAGPAPHPGETLKDELEARGLSPHALAIALRLPASRISQIVRGQRAVTPETALRLARYFGGSAAIWLRLQVAYDLARAEAELAAKIEAEVTPAAA